MRRSSRGKTITERQTAAPRSPRIGLLPLYLKLYDEASPGARTGFDGFLRDVVGEFQRRGIEVIRSNVCRIGNEFRAAVRQFEKAGVDCVVTLHLAYSPSLESVNALADTKLPILILDVTMDWDFGRRVSPGRIMFNHGIHGVMDLACMLRRRGKSYQIVAGHARESKVMDRAEAILRGAHAAASLRRTKALRIGPAFRGMGDFSVDERVLGRELGITVEEIGLDRLARETRQVSAREVQAEIMLDRRRFDCRASSEAHRRSARVSLGLRRLLDKGRYTAFSMNFLAFDRSDGPVNVVPFLEASKAMARGIGYAGEGDVLTAALVGALLQGFGAATFTEIFCPDWRGNSLFLSHMGEINPRISSGRARLVEKIFPYTSAANPVILACAPKAGPAVFVNLAPGPGTSFRLIVAPVEALGDSLDARMKDSVRAWVRPKCRIERFLEEYSMLGGTHHSALVLGDKTEEILAMGRFLGLDTRKIL